MAILSSSDDADTLPNNALGNCMSFGRGFWTPTGAVRWCIQISRSIRRQRAKFYVFSRFCSSTLLAGLDSGPILVLAECFGTGGVIIFCETESLQPTDRSSSRAQLIMGVTNCDNANICNSRFPSGSISRIRESGNKRRPSRAVLSGT